MIIQFVSLPSLLLICCFPFNSGKFILDVLETNWQPKFHCLILYAALQIATNPEESHLSLNMDHSHPKTLTLSFVLCGDIAEFSDLKPVVNVDENGESYGLLLERNGTLGFFTSDARDHGLTSSIVSAFAPAGYEKCDEISIKIWPTHHAFGNMRIELELRIVSENTATGVPDVTSHELSQRYYFDLVLLDPTTTEITSQGETTSVSTTSVSTTVPVDMVTSALTVALPALLGRNSDIIFLVCFIFVCVILAFSVVLNVVLCCKCLKCRRSNKTRMEASEELKSAA